MDKMIVIHVILNGLIAASAVILSYFSYVWYTKQKSGTRRGVAIGFCLFAVGEAVTFGLTLTTVGKIDFSNAGMFYLFNAISAAGIIVAAIFYGKVTLQERRLR